MQKPALLRAIFAELRAGLGPEVAARDILKLAHVILRSYTEELEDTADLNDKPGRLPFWAAPVDEAMRDGGWRILEYETAQRSSVDDLTSGETNLLRLMIERYLGPEWRHQTLQGQL